MNPTARILWAVLAFLLTLVTWRLTHLITHVDHEARASFAVAIDEQPPYAIDLSRVNLQLARQNRFRLPAIVFVGPRNVLFITTPATRAVTIASLKPNQLSCGFLDGVLHGAALTDVAEAAGRATFKPLPLEPAGSDGTLIRAPDAMRAALAGAPGTQGEIRCMFLQPLAARPTYTDRSITVQVRNGKSGYAMLDISALDDIDNVRVTGGLTIPFSSGRTQLLTPTDDVVAIEWNDVSAQERRDIILVIIGALSAITAAVAIEAIRPFIEREPAP
jgi:hypothetical protein